MNEENNLENKSEEKKIKKEKKVETLKTFMIKRIIFLIVFFLIALAITSYLVKVNPFQKDKEMITTSKSKEIIKEDEFTRNHVSMINLEEDTFNYNSLKIDNVKENYEGLDINYFQIDGLKDSKIENKINNQLKQDIEKIIDENLSNGNIKKEGFDTYGYISANFSNVISMTYYMSSYSYDQEMRLLKYDWDKTICENFNLITGERIKLQDLFTDDTLGSDIFDNIFYSELVSHYATSEGLIDENDYWTGYEVITDYKDIEDLILELVLNFNNGKDFEFYFNEHSVTLMDYYSTIYFEDHLEFLALYNRFKSNSNIFTDDYPALKNLPVLVKRFPVDYQMIEESNQYYLDVNVNYLDFEYGKEENEEDKIIYAKINLAAMEHINHEIEELKKKEVTPGKFCIYNYSYNIYENTDRVDRYDSDLGHMTYDWVGNGTYRVGYTKAKLETTTSVYNSELKSKIIKIFRTVPRIETGEARLYDNLFYQYWYEEEEDGYMKMNQEWEIVQGEFHLDKMR